MEFLCEKYKQSMEEEGAYCRHPFEYCKFRTACLINFVSKENRPKVELTVVVPEETSVQKQ